MRGFKSIFVSLKHKINCFLIQEKYFQTANAVDTLPLKTRVTFGGVSTKEALFNTAQRRPFLYFMS